MSEAVTQNAQNVQNVPKCSQNAIKCFMKDNSSFMIMTFSLFFEANRVVQQTDTEYSIISLDKHIVPIN